MDWTRLAHEGIQWGCCYYSDGPPGSIGAEEFLG
jgi:hypothetical protein